MGYWLPTLPMGSWVAEIVVDEDIAVSLIVVM